MKKAFVLLLTSGLLAAQTSDLLSTNWYISKIVVNGQSTNSPVMDTSFSASTFNTAGTNGYVFTSRYYNSSPVSLEFIPNNNVFIKAGSGCTLWYYNGGNAINVNPYDQKNCDFYVNTPSNTQYNYQITNSGSGKTLIITDPSGNQIHYNSFFLNTHETNESKKLFKAYPNPAKESLTIENIDKNLSIKVYDLSGKLILETKSNDQKVKIETISLQKGQYIVAVENYAPYKFTKE
ncbi:T9SS type A sorting domain-containing protein [Chryseobacterium polytrichastri]|uniref:Por secretion system C-terminal sorting domain-containing protein n=1 Tax=Chryseobacterium polytrichastri TaxID=1302687 RepID=A0A1M7HKZ6_9FLAO|nr:T9SS type A sorting domain-containing protein [Chryseobacterium polytrichastri]SHM29211.1 Por secretion system C-terminal sorting domain-containing protein [Chryseobacterium polytrichastri]